MNIETVKQLPVFVRLQMCRMEFQKRNVKKSGMNKFSGFKYYELGDILPHINEINLEYGITFTTHFTAESATLLMHDCYAGSEQPRHYEIASSSLADATTKGMTPIQALGSQKTYIRRYLLMDAYDITENDWVDSQPLDNKPESVTAEQRQVLYKVGGVAGITKDQIEARCKKQYKTELKYLTKKQYDETHAALKAAADKKGGK